MDLEFERHQDASDSENQESADEASSSSEEEEQTGDFQLGTKRNDLLLMRKV